MIRHTLKLRNGQTAMKLNIRFDSAANVEAFYRLTANVIQAERTMKAQGTDAACEQYGHSVMDLYALVLGQDAARAVEAWFGSNVLAMVTQINTFIRTVVQPDVDKCSRIHRERMKRSFLKQQKRAMNHAAQ